MDIRGVVFDVDDTLYDMAQPFLGARLDKGISFHFVFRT